VALNSHHWNHVFERDFLPQLRGLVEVLETRLLPAFNDIDSESQHFADQLWSEAIQMPASGDDDRMDQIAEAVRDAGVDHYMLLDGLRQGSVNLFAASIHHAFEQQLLMFLRRELLEPFERNNSKLFAIGVVRARLQTYGIDLYQFCMWPEIDELRLVANVVKHADGESAKRLHQLRPDYFRQSGFPGLGEWELRWDPHVFQPLIGRDLYVQSKDVRLYLNSLIEFWRQFAAALISTATP
jgi:hypothetical protein